MKTNKAHKHKKPIHLHIEHISRMPVILALVSGLFAIAIVKSDSRMLGLVRQAYAEGYGLIGAYMREETVRTPVTFAAIRPNTISGK